MVACTQCINACDIEHASSYAFEQGFGQVILLQTENHSPGEILLHLLCLCYVREKLSCILRELSPMMPLSGERI